MRLCTFCLYCAVAVSNQRILQNILFRLKLVTWQLLSRWSTISCFEETWFMEWLSHMLCSHLFPYSFTVMIQFWKYFLLDFFPIYFSHLFSVCTSIQNESPIQSTCSKFSSTTTAATVKLQWKSIASECNTHVQLFIEKMKLIVNEIFRVCRIKWLAYRWTTILLRKRDRLHRCRRQFHFNRSHLGIYHRSHSHHSKHLLVSLAWCRSRNSHMHHHLLVDLQWVWTTIQHRMHSHHCRHNYPLSNRPQQTVHQLINIHHK